MNLNDRVRVKLNDHGRQWLRSFYEQTFQDWPEHPAWGSSREQVIQDSIDLWKPKEDGYTYTQLWSLIDTFGGTIRMGRPVPFESTEIEPA